MSSMPIAPLDERKQSILKAVVVDYVRTAEPVGSQSLLARHEFNVKSATIRNEMAELSELGYLCQPHTSAGRIPSDMGYRFYVDRLMDYVGIPAIQARQLRTRLLPRVSEIDMIIEQTCRLLADLSQYATIATLPLVKDAIISHINLSHIGNKKLLVVIVLNNGAVLHEILDFHADANKLDSNRATNFLMEQLKGKTLDDARKYSSENAPPEAAEFKDLLDKVLDLIKAELKSAEEMEIHFEGANYIMQQPEFKDVERLEALLSILEEKSVLSKVLTRVFEGSDTTVIIGSENPVYELRDCSFVGTTYSISGRAAGTIGVVGPTRMDYPRAIGAVSFMAKSLGDVLEMLMV